MRILIAESKTMTHCDGLITPAVLAARRPCLDPVATTLMESWSQWSPSAIASALKVSPAIAADFMTMAYEFPNKTLGSKAIEAFTGVVFKALDYGSLSPDEKTRADRMVNIISSVYGWLRSDDIVKRYRLDYTARMAPSNETMARYWRPVVTPLLADSLRCTGDNEIVDLLPADAAKCIDWSKIKHLARVVKVDFKSVADGGRLKTPHSTLLKTLRGRLLREILHKNIGTIGQLFTLTSSTMWVDPESDPDSGTLTILVAICFLILR